MIRVGIVGATGYAGAELVRILCGHPQVELTILTSRQFAGVRFDEVYPAMSGCVNLVCEELAVEKVCDRADIVFTALPHRLPMALVPEFVKRKVRVPPRICSTKPFTALAKFILKISDPPF